MVGPPSKTHRMKDPIPWETYAVVLEHHENHKNIHFIAESKGTQGLAWRDRNGKQSLTAITAPIDPDLSQWLDITFGDEGYEVNRNMLPQDVLPYALSWNTDGTVLVLGLTQFPTAQSSLLESYLAVISDDSSKALHVKFPLSPKNIVWRDPFAFYIRAGDITYIVDLKRETPEPKVVQSRPEVDFHAFQNRMLIYSDGDDLFAHERKVYTFKSFPRYVYFDYPYLALQDGNTVMVMGIRGKVQKSLPLQQDDALIGLSTAQKTLFIRRGLTAIDKLRFLDDRERENIFDISDVYPAYSRSEKSQR